MDRDNVAALWQATYDEQEDLDGESATERLTQLGLRVDVPRPLVHLESVLQLWDAAGEDQYLFYLSYEELSAHSSHALYRKILQYRPDTWRVSSQESLVDGEIEKVLYGTSTMYVQLYNIPFFLSHRIFQALTHIPVAPKRRGSRCSIPISGTLGTATM